jgi:hypothetical protein
VDRKVEDILLLYIWRSGGRTKKGKYRWDGWVLEGGRWLGTKRLDMCMGVVEEKGCRTWFVLDGVECDRQWG